MRAVDEDDDIRVSWATPSGFFTRMTLRQCRDSGDPSDDCISHNVTNVTTVSVSRSNGTLLTLVVWQGRDDVLSYDLGMFLESTDSDSGEGRGFNDC